MNDFYPDDDMDDEDDEDDEDMDYFNVSHELSWDEALHEARILRREYYSDDDDDMDGGMMIPAYQPNT